MCSVGGVPRTMVEKHCLSSMWLPLHKCSLSKLSYVEFRFLDLFY